VLSQEQVEQFWQDGFLVVPNLLSATDTGLLKERAELIAGGAASHVADTQLQVEPAALQGEAEVEDRASSLRKMSHVAFVDDVFRAHAMNSNILDCVEALLGADLKLYQDQLFMKPPHIGSRQPYHQDQPLGFTVDPADRMVTCWAALDEATIDNGCLWMLPGTHKHGWIEKQRWLQYEQQSVAGALPEEQPVELQAGDCSFHHGHILHSSRPNRTPMRRWGYATHYVSAHCRFTGQGTSDALLARGHSIPGCI
jgi:phytanoyl-CoA hydroxylase